MSIRFQRRVTIFPGIVINFGKSGFNSVTFGCRFFSLNVGRDGTYFNSSLAGTGIRYRKRLDKTTSTKSNDKN